MNEILEAIPFAKFLSGLPWETIGKGLLAISIIVIWRNAHTAKQYALQSAAAVSRELTDCRKQRQSDQTYILKMVQIMSETFGVIRAVTGADGKPPAALYELELRAKVLLATVTFANGSG